jgi:2-aminomuconate deaminase
MTGKAIIVDDRAPALAKYPHARLVNDTIYVSGVSSRRKDGTHVGATKNDDGTFTLDVGAQTKAVIENIAAILQAAGASLQDVVDMTVILVDMKDYAAMNAVYDTFFTPGDGPARTTFAAKELPHPNLLVEMKAVAVRGAR